MSSTVKWVIAALVAAVLLVAAGALGSYLIRTTTERSNIAFRSELLALADSGTRAQRKHDDSLMAIVLAANGVASEKAAAARHVDTVITADTGAIAQLRAALASAQTDHDRLVAYPPLVAKQDTTIHDLTTSRDDWRTGFSQQATANAALIAVHAADTVFQRRLLGKIDSFPKPPRADLVFQFTHPHPYLRAEWGIGGARLAAGVCVGKC